MKCWAKRGLLVPQLLRMVLRRQKLQRYGASIGPATVIASLNIEGDASRIVIGCGCAIGRIDVQLHDRVKIGDRVVINDGARILTGTHNVHSSQWELITKPVIIEDYCWLAMNALVLPGVRIGEGSVVGAGAVVSRDVEPFSIVAGNPARKIGQRARDLSYEPARGFALFEAWLGPVKSMDKPV